jgi:hypothetical protein
MVSHSSCRANPGWFVEFASASFMFSPLSKKYYFLTRFNPFYRKLTSRKNHLSPPLQDYGFLATPSLLIVTQFAISHFRRTTKHPCAKP